MPKFLVKWQEDRITGCSAVIEAADEEAAMDFVLDASGQLDEYERDEGEDLFDKNSVEVDDDPV